MKAIVVFRYPGAQLSENASLCDSPVMKHQSMW